MTTRETRQTQIPYVSQWLLSVGLQQLDSLCGLFCLPCLCETYILRFEMGLYKIQMATKNSIYSRKVSSPLFSNQLMHCTFTLYIIILGHESAFQASGRVLLGEEDV